VHIELREIITLFILCWKRRFDPLIPWTYWYIYTIGETLTVAYNVSPPPNISLRSPILGHDTICDVGVPPRRQNTDCPFNLNSDGIAMRQRSVFRCLSVLFAMVE